MSLDLRCDRHVFSPEAQGDKVVSNTMANGALNGRKAATSYWIALGASYGPLASLYRGIQKVEPRLWALILVWCRLQSLKVDLLFGSAIWAPMLQG